MLVGDGNGTGGYVFLRITAVSGALYSGENNGISAPWAMPLSWPENNAPTFDNSYRKCYNKRSDNNKNVICHQTGKNALVSRFCLYGYKIPLSRQKRFTANLHKNWKYKIA